MHVRVCVRVGLDNWNWTEMLQCVMCRRTFASHWALDVHVRYGHKNEVEVGRTCTRCRNRFSSVALLKKHIRECSRTCADCSVVFGTTEQHRGHVCVPVSALAAEKIIWGWVDFALCDTS